VVKTERKKKTEGVTQTKHLGLSIVSLLLVSPISFSHTQMQEPPLSLRAAIVSSSNKLGFVDLAFVMS